MSDSPRTTVAGAPAHDTHVVGCGWDDPAWRELLRSRRDDASSAGEESEGDDILESLGAAPVSHDADAQQRHYDAVATAYLHNLEQPQVQAYQSHLDDVLDRALAASGGNERLGTLVELCCGHAEGLVMHAGRYERGIGVDVSRRMLEAARTRLADAPCRFIHGDATSLPLRDGVADSILLLGGIHHVNDRAGLYREVERVLRPGGRLIFREPLDDLWLWRALRAIIYRISPNLDAETERPLRRRSTMEQLEAAGLRVVHWQPAGLIGFCLFMNTDVLIANRLFRFVPGIRSIVRATAAIDAMLLRVPGLRNAGLQVIGVATKPAEPMAPMEPEGPTGTAGVQR